MESDDESVERRAFKKIVEAKLKARPGMSPSSDFCTFEMLSFKVIIVFNF